MSKKSDNDDKLNELAVAKERNASNIQNLKETVERLEERLDVITAQVASNKTEINLAVKEEFAKYVLYVEFETVKTLVFGLVGGILLTVLIAVLALVVMPKVTPTTINSNPLALSNMIQPGLTPAPTGQ